MQASRKSRPLEALQSARTALFFGQFRLSRFFNQGRSENLRPPSPRQKQYPSRCSSRASNRYLFEHRFVAGPIIIVVDLSER